MASFNKPTVFGGLIWIDIDGTFIYECKFCQHKSIFARSIEMHISRQHENELRPKQNVPSENEPLSRTSEETRYRPPSLPSSSMPLQTLPSSTSISQPQTTMPTKSSIGSLGSVDTGSRRSNPIQTHSQPKRMKLNDGTSANATAEIRKPNPFALSNRHRHTIDNNHSRTLPSTSTSTPASALASASTSSSKSSRHHVYFGSRHSNPVKPKSPHTHRTKLSAGIPIHSVKKCRKCNQKFNSADSLQSHTQHCHKLVCIYCQTEQPKPFKTELGFFNHQRKQHAVIFKHKCKICVRAFKHRQELKKHLLTHDHRIKTVKCGYCLRTFVSTFQKDEHIKANHMNCLMKKQIV